jgi:ethanolamine utilization protein EutQ
VKKLITANDIRAAHARGEEEISVVLRASIITPEAREVAELLGVAIQECDESAPEPAVPAAEEKPKASAFAKPLSRSCRKGSLPKAWWRS